LHGLLGVAVLVERSRPEGLAAPPAIEASLIDLPLPSLRASADQAVAPPPPRLSSPRRSTPPDPPRFKPRPQKRPPPVAVLEAVAPAPVRPIAPAQAVALAPASESATSPPGRSAAPAGSAAPGGAPVRERGAAAKARDPYAAQVLAWLEGRKHMPEDLRRRRARGVVVVAFTLDRWGRLSGPAVVESSGDRAVDAAALNLLVAAAPFPRAPREADWSRRHFEMPIGYAALEEG
jgi:protein TonB